VLSGTQAGVRAAKLMLNGQSALDAWTSAGNLQQSMKEVTYGSGPAIYFSGVLGSELNRVLAGATGSVMVTSPALKVDQPIQLPRGGITLDLGTSALTSAGANPYMLRIEGIEGVVIRGGALTSGSAGLLVSNSNQVRIEGMELRSLSSHGIVVTGSSGVVIRRNRLHGISGAPIMLHRGTVSSVVEHNDIDSNLGPSNVTAGIVLTDREVDLTSSPSAIFGPDGYWVISQPITSRLHPPHDNLIAYNRIMSNASSGIYVDGAVRNSVVFNTIAGNTKEGLCLDNGATANVVASNVIEQNGDRWGESDWVLTEDQVIAGGRLPDGTAAEKVPGISLDNAVYNIVFDNDVSHNFGGGIKMVRTGYFNLIGLNTVFSDNDGASASFHFFGIELGATPGDGSSDEFDYTPSHGNLVFSNSIRGAHYSGIYFDTGSDQNDVFENTILDATTWALESVAVMANSSLNNLTNLPSRNIGSGLDPALLTIGQPVLDPSSKYAGLRITAHELRR